MASRPDPDQKLIETQNAKLEILCEHQTVFCKKGDLNTAAADINNGGPFLDHAVKVFAL